MRRLFRQWWQHGVMGYSVADKTWAMACKRAYFGAWNDYARGNTPQAVAAAGLNWQRTCRLTFQVGFVSFCVYLSFPPPSLSLCVCVCVCVRACAHVRVSVCVSAGVYVCGVGTHSLHTVPFMSRCFCSHVEGAHCQCNQQPLIQSYHTCTFLGCFVKMAAVEIAELYVYRVRAQICV